MEPIQCSVENAPKLADWIANHGGIAIWDSANLSNPGATWLMPVNDAEGKPTGKPSWQAGSVIDTVLSTDQVEVTVPKEVKRFHVAVRRGDGLSFVLTDGSSRRVKKEVEKAGENAWYEFDYFSQECVILVPDTKVTLTEWLKLTKGSKDENHSPQTATT